MLPQVESEWKVKGHRKARIFDHERRCLAKWFRTQNDTWQAENLIDISSMSNGWMSLTTCE